MSLDHLASSGGSSVVDMERFVMLHQRDTPLAWLTAFSSILVILYLLINPFITTLIPKPFIQKLFLFLLIISYRTILRSTGDTRSYPCHYNKLEQGSSIDCVGGSC